MLICITGQIGSGKTSVLKEFQNLGFKTFEMDEYIHNIYKKGEIGYQLIKKTFGDLYVNDVEVDRKKLGQLVFNNKEMLDKLNNLTIPIIQQKIIELKKLNDDIFVELGIFLNYEAEFENLFDYVILVKGKSELQLKKLEDLSWFDKKSKIFSPLKSSNENKYIVLENNKEKKYIETLVKNALEILGIKK